MDAFVADRSILSGYIRDDRRLLPDMFSKQDYGVCTKKGSSLSEKVDEAVQTKIEDMSGIINMTKEASFASVDVGIAYGESIERVEAVLKKELPKVARRLPAVMEGPYYRGVSELGDNSVDIKIVTLCKEQDRIQLSRDLNREILLIFNKNEIDIPFPQVTVSNREEKQSGK